PDRARPPAPDLRAAESARRPLTTTPPRGRDPVPAPCEDSPRGSQVTTSPPPESAAPAAAPPRSWRKRHPVLARTLLYGGMLAVLGAGAWVGAALLEESRPGGLLATIQGPEQGRDVDPDRALPILREDVLPKNPNEDVRRRAVLAEAAVLDCLRRY